MQDLQFQVMVACFPNHALSYSLYLFLLVFSCDGLWAQVYRNGVGYTALFATSMFLLEKEESPQVLRV